MTAKKDVTRKFGMPAESRTEPNVEVFCAYCCRSTHRISALEQSTVALNGMIGDLKSGLADVRKNMATELTAIRGQLDSIQASNERREQRDLEISAELAATKVRDERREEREKQSLAHLETMLALLRASTKGNGAA